MRHVWIWVLAIGGLILVASVLWAAPALPQQIQCMARDEMLKLLLQQFKEAPVHMALTSNGQMLEVTVSEAGTWTVLISSPEGRACIASAGEHWETVGKPPPAGDETDS